ncbi:MAG: hypothetical protein RLZZ385_42 [Pseudomonadota bacterium]
MKNTLLHASLILTLGCGSPLTAAQGLERLFTTPVQRAALDQARERATSGFDLVAVPVPEPESPSAPELPQQAESIFSLGGTLVRTDGRFQVWINDRMYGPDTLPDHMEMLQPYARGRLRIIDRQSGESWTLSPGQTLNMSTGQVYEAYQRPAVGSPQPVANGQ